MRFYSAQISAYIGLYTALCVVIGFVLAPIPNVELMTLSVFLGGYFFGMLYGGIIGACSMFLFSAFNPWGSGLAFPPMLAAQVVSYGIIGICGALVRRMFHHNKALVFILGFCGGFLSFLYYIVVTVSFAPAAGFNLKQTGVALLAGVSFSVVGIGVNILSFALLGPILIRTAQRFPFMRKFSQTD
jgi:uncharacterized membrane protein